MEEWADALQWLQPAGMGDAENQDDKTFARRLPHCHRQALARDIVNVRVFSVFGGMHSFSVTSGTDSSLQTFPKVCGAHRRYWRDGAYWNDH